MTTEVKPTNGKPANVNRIGLTQQEYRGGDSTLVVGGIQRAETNAHQRGAARIAARAPAVSDCGQIPARVGVKPETGCNLSGLQQRMLVVGLQLDNLLVEGARLRKKSLEAEAVGDAGELFHRARDVTGAHVEIAERVRGGPVARLVFDQAGVFRDRGFELSLPQQLLSVAQRRGAVDWHDDQSMVSNSDGGRNVRRCTSE